MAHRIIQEAVAQGKVLAAICIAPVTLARAGMLQSKQATVFESAISEMELKGVFYGLHCLSTLRGGSYLRCHMHNHSGS